MRRHPYASAHQGGCGEPHDKFKLSTVSSKPVSETSSVGGDSQVSSSVSSNVQRHEDDRNAWLSTYSYRTAVTFLGPAKRRKLVGSLGEASRGRRRWRVGGGVEGGCGGVAVEMLLEG
ncbi:hypothetical protein F441_12823 [Phytophthora nicotianae CJ01A1]|uniref:Uncharacterized protein n=3 Tax=Phytophthora nicotianae TaxID=4792 RepID=W2WNF7_PHYNI|nr:hypothetical protein L915_01926 [Phytophthora nicotianae]ETO84037.1 hypothetical protein F444_02019 [Phytophthora nicotianae P1976]ETP11678.1 hypothetical protein F441_12823 [Phytophthora nicotianae CJ01A1]